MIFYKARGSTATKFFDGATARTCIRFVFVIFFQKILQCTYKKLVCF
uniref:Uncharacterized protein n=1 Tax=Anguilla anguilla TaxID=7936 RepID=A0A0E9SFX4_ANGAN